ncbi:uncharacterized protein B0H18DRAFT_247132 [Fomitopsis serialis]|uniref:uncharacterized protein n=1 Tax=Fomitopsis serialis TaxID=139415 RepID=UPI00200890E4|nr:uncharacterized protein B0H18DRAFT_247132 [Neoantrodia serialis]KAH9928733.1 hypothetical protein B0H18DRAFT_247132 [Neoantrodia serialis]
MIPPGASPTLWMYFKLEDSDAQPQARDDLAADVRPMRYADIPNVVATHRAAFANDPVWSYLFRTPDDATCSRLSRWLDSLVYFLQCLGRVHARKMLVINDGDAYLYFGLPGGKPTVVERIIGRSTSFLRKVRTAEQKKRMEETMQKQDAAIKAAIGERIHSMFAAHDLATHPGKQGRGYGGALVAAANAKADALGAASWLSSSNVANTAFYESCGFVVVREFAIGDENPTWMEPPIVVRIMVREQQGAAHDLKEEMV